MNMDVHAYSGETTQELQRNMPSIWIAHRGNTRGPNPEKENQPDYILQAINEGFDVEIDVWGKPTEDGIDVHACSEERQDGVVQNMELWLGHDSPQYQIPLSFLTINEDRLWCHAKNFHALTFLIQHKFHTFSHENDTHVLTSRGIIWAYVGKEIDQNTICVMPERTSRAYTNSELRQAKGICTDYVHVIRNILQLIE